MQTINNNIEEARVGFEVAKLLNDAGFNVPTIWWVNNYEYGEYEEPISNTNIRLDFLFSTPTQQVAIDWIRVNFGLHIQTPFSYSDGKKYLWCVTKIDEETEDNCWLSGMDTDEISFITPEEAKEAAIKYVLEKLIKK